MSQAIKNLNDAIDALTWQDIKALSEHYESSVSALSAIQRACTANAPVNFTDNDRWRVIPIGPEDNRIHAIKELRNMTLLGFDEAKRVICGEDGYQYYFMASAAPSHFRVKHVKSEHKGLVRV